MLGCDEPIVRYQSMKMTSWAALGAPYRAQDCAALAHGAGGLGDGQTIQYILHAELAMARPSEGSC